LHPYMFQLMINLSKFVKDKNYSMIED
jgi:hypothetical protein